MQVFAIRLHGEPSIITHACEVKDYEIDRVIEADADPQAPGSERPA